MRIIGQQVPGFSGNGEYHTILGLLISALMIRKALESRSSSDQISRGLSLIHSESSDPPRFIPRAVVTSLYASLYASHISHIKYSIKVSSTSNISPEERKEKWDYPKQF